MISVVIPTYNRAEMLSRVLPSYLASESVSEVIVVNDGSSDKTELVVQQFSRADPRVILVQHSHNLGRTRARNTGIARARGRLLLMSEDDLAVTPGSIETLLSHMDETDADIIAGRRIWMRVGETESQALERANKRSWPVVNRRLLEHYAHAITPTDQEAFLVDSTMLVHRRVFDKVSYADCYRGNAWREESDFQVTAQKLGFKVVFCPHAVFFHYDRPMAGRGKNRFLADMVYLYWIFHNNLIFLRRHRLYIAEKMPSALILGSPLLAALVNLIYRGGLLAQTEFRRAWRSRKYLG